MRRSTEPTRTSCLISLAYPTLSLRGSLYPLVKLARAQARRAAGYHRFVSQRIERVPSWYAAPMLLYATLHDESARML